MASVKNWYEHFHGGLDVPDTVCDGISDSTAYQTEEEKKEALLLYYLHTMPMASWQNVAGALHYMKEETALQAVKAFLKYTLAGQLILYSAPRSECQLFKTVFLRNLNIVHVHVYIENAMYRACIPLKKKRVVFFFKGRTCNTKSCYIIKILDHNINYVS